MPRNQAQRMIFALLTVIVTVHAFVFYNLYVVNGNSLMELHGVNRVLEAIRLQGGVYMFGHYLPIWSVVLVEFAFAYSLEVLMGSPCSFRLAMNVFNPRETKPILFETAIICATVCLMCPAMSFIAAWLYYPYFEEFSLVHLLSNWFKLVCCNFPFALFSQLFFIQPLIRRLFQTLFRKDLARREKEPVS